MPRLSWRVRLRRDWRKIVRYAWSMKLLAAAGLLQGVEIALPLARDIVEIPAGIFAGLSLLATAAAFVARILAQKQFGGDDGE
jgi:hypothetical protein